MDTVIIPSPWRAMHDLAEAISILEANPDLIGEHIALALESEAPGITKFLDAVIYTIKEREGIAGWRRVHANHVLELAKRDDAAAAKLRKLLPDLQRRLRLKTYRSPSGPSTLTFYPGKPIVTEPDDVPAQFKTTEVVTTFRLREIAAEYAANRPVPGTEQGNGYESVRIG